jgi:hypothetical protein
MPEGIMAAVWAFSWGLVAASGALVGAILGLTANLRHRAIAAFMSLGAGVLLSAASFKVASEALILAGAALTTVAMIAGAATFSVVNAALVKGRDRKRCGECKPQPSEARCPAVEPRLRSAPCLMRYRSPDPRRHPAGRGTRFGADCRARARKCARSACRDGRDASRLSVICLRARSVGRHHARYRGDDGLCFSLRR